MPAWVTSLNEAPPSGPIRESRRPRSSRVLGRAARPERVRTRQATAPFQPLQGVYGGEPSSLHALARSEAGPWPPWCTLSEARAGNPLIPGARARTPPSQSLLGAGIPTTCSRADPPATGG